jgi:hypothetical protein
LRIGRSKLSAGVALRLLVQRLVRFIRAVPPTDFPASFAQGRENCWPFRWPFSKSRSDSDAITIVCGYSAGPFLAPFPRSSG